MGSGLQRFLGPVRGYIINDISIGSAVFAQCTVVLNTETTLSENSIAIARIYAPYCNEFFLDICHRLYSYCRFINDCVCTCTYTAHVIVCSPLSLPPSCLY